MWHMGDGWGWWMVFGMVMMTAFWVVVVWAVVALVQRPPDASGRPRPDQEPAGLEILERRYARGELTDTEFERMRAQLVRRPDVTPRDRPGSPGTPPDGS